MKVVSVMTTSSRGGAEFAAVELLDALCARGHEAVLISDQPAIGRDTRVRVEPIEIGPKLSRSSYAHLAVRWVPYLRRLRAALEREMPYDALLLHYKKEQLMARWLPAHLRPRLAWAEWGPVPFPLRKGLPHRMYLRAARDADVVMAISRGTYDNLVEVGVPADKVVVVNNAMRTDELRFSPDGRARVRAELGIPADAFTVGCISRLHPKKRNDVVVRATAGLGDGAHLVLAGEGETEPELRSLAVPLGDRAHFVTTPGAEVADVISAFDVSVFCPSPTEGAPRAVLLGMLAERACVSTGAEGVRDLLVDGTGAILSPENDTEALTALLAGLRDDPAGRARAGSQARAHVVATHDTDVVARRAEELLFGGGPPR
jgi:glycosyltransferase involved in cell wall biosynthesis